MLAVITLRQFLQLGVNGLVNGTFYGLLGASFALILGVTGRFHFAYGLTFTISAYIASTFTDHHLHPLPAALLGILSATILGVAIERVVYRPLAASSGPYALLTIFVSSLGLATAGQNLIKLIYNKSASKQIGGYRNRALRVGDITIRTLDIMIVVVSWVLILGLAFILARTLLGRTIRAVRVNPEMALVVGVNPALTYLIVFAIGSAMGGVAAIFFAMKSTATPDMGFRPVFYAFVVAFLAGLTRSPIRAGLVGVVLGLVESLSALKLSAGWSSIVVFAILFIYIATKPLELSRRFGRRPALRSTA